MVAFALVVGTGNNLLSGGQILADCLNGASPTLNKDLLNLLDRVDAINVPAVEEVDEGAEDHVQAVLSEHNVYKLHVPVALEVVLADGAGLQGAGLEGVGA